MLGMSGFADPDNFLHLATATLALYFGSVAAGGAAARDRLTCRGRGPGHARAGRQHDRNTPADTRRGVHRPETTRRPHGGNTDDGTVNATSPLAERRVTDAAPGRRPTQEVAVVNTGDTAWILTSAALVLLMTPGLALFYGGMVRAKSVLNMMMMSFGALALISVLWVLYGYSLAFGNDVGGGLLGNPFEFFGLKGLMEDTTSRGRRPARRWPSSPSRPSSRSSPSR